MQRHHATPKKGKAATAEDAFALLVAEASRPGFFGTVSLTLNVQDGSIQQVRATTDRLVR